jgi:hypothetical protein
LRPFFSAQALLLAPYRPMKGMLVARAAPAPKNPGRKRDHIYETDHLDTWTPGPPLDLTGKSATVLT